MAAHTPSSRANPGTPSPDGEVFTDILRFLAVQSCRRELLRCGCGGTCRACQGWRAFVLANTRGLVQR